MDATTSRDRWDWASRDNGRNWLDRLYAACETLRASKDGLITAVSVTVPRTDRPDNFAQVELLGIGLAKVYDLDVEADTLERTIKVRFTVRTPVAEDNMELHPLAS